MSRPQYQQQLSSSDTVNRIGFPPPPPPPPPPATSNGPGLAHRATTLRRGKTLTRPERQVAAAPLLTPPAPILPGAAQLVPANANAERLNWWILCSFVCTFWAPPSLLSACGLKDTATRQAWREKFALCTIAAVIGGIVAFLTMGLTRTLCPEGDNRRQDSLSPLGKTPGVVGVRGWAVNVSQSVVTSSVNFYDIGRSQAGQDITNLFGRSDGDYPSCAAFSSRFATTPLCDSTSCPLPQLSGTTLDSLKLVNTTRQIGYSWANVSSQANFLVVDGNVLNLYPYLRGNPNPIADDPVDAIIRTVVGQKAGGKDATRLLYSSAFPQKAVPCLVDRYYAGQIDKITPGCMLSTLFLFVSLGIILAVVFARFLMAWIFSWFISARMVRPPKHLSQSAVSPMVMPSAGAKFSVDAPGGTAPWRGGTVRQQRPTKGGGRAGRSAGGDTAVLAPADKPAPLVTQTQIGAELFAVCLVTCYSESLESIKGTCDSLANTTYADGRKLLFIVADGMITGAGETVSTPDHCVGLLEADERFGNPLPMGYLAVGSGRKRENRAMVYAGHYRRSPPQRLERRRGGPADPFTYSHRSLRLGSRCASRADRRRRQVRHAVRGVREQARQPRQARLAAHPDELLFARHVQRPDVAARL
jgi:chitin synthase